MHSILAVDDSASMRQMVTFTLKSAGYNVVEAVDGQDAWEKSSTVTLPICPNLGIAISTWCSPTRTCPAWTASA